MKCMRSSAYLTIVVSLIGGPVVAFGQSTCTEQVTATLRDLDDWQPVFAGAAVTHSLCPGGVDDLRPIAVEIRQEAETVLGASAKGLLEVSLEDRSRALIARIGGYSELRYSETEEIVYKALADRIRQVAVKLGTGESPALLEDWQVDGGQIPAVNFPIHESVEDACQRLDAACEAAIDLALDVRRIARLTQISMLTERRIPDEQLLANALRAKKWKEYWSNARSQYPWELLLNGRRMPDTREEIDGVKQGFRDVPTDQMILLHPDVALEYVEDAAEGSRFEEAVVVDLIGYNRWWWNSDGSMGFAVGASLIAAVSDRAGSDDFGWGAMVHVNNRWSLGITDHDGDLGILVSADLADLWTKVSEKKKNWLMTGEN